MRPFVCVWAKAEDDRNKTAIIEVAFPTIISFQPEKKGAQLLGAQASRLHSVRQHAQMIRYSSAPIDSAALFSRYALIAGGMSTPAGLPRRGPRTPALPALRSFRARNQALLKRQSLAFAHRPAFTGLFSI